MSKKISGNIVDILQRKIYKGTITICDNMIQSIVRLEDSVHVPEQYIMPGFIDAHIHIESSMMSPSAFASIAVQHGTVATVSDPHEIANVCGMPGIHYMIKDGSRVPFKFYFGAPSCVPATPFETAGAVIDKNDIDTLLQMSSIKYLSEMMNFPGVLNNDALVMEKIALAKKYNKPVDGHAPGLLGDQAIKYINAGISTDHECTTLEEAIWKAQHGMHILIREGSAAKNFDALIPILKSHPKQVMFCSDDKHPDALVSGHINQLVQKAIKLGYDVFDVLHAACVLPVQHYNLKVGLLQIGDPADCIVVKDLETFDVINSYINGEQVVENCRSHIHFSGTETINNFNCAPIIASDISHDDLLKQKEIPVMVALDGQLITERITFNLEENNIVSLPDITNDILKIIVVNRYQKDKPAIGFIKNFGLKHGAIASSVAHDSHNIVAVGVSDEDIVSAVNAVIAKEGGISVYDGTNTFMMHLPIAGLMSDKDAYTVAREYELLDAKAKSLGSTLAAPFMTLSFMALPVIPHLKITDKGMFDVDTFAFVSA